MRGFHFINYFDYIMFNDWVDKEGKNATYKSLTRFVNEQCYYIYLLYQIYLLGVADFANY